MKMAPIFTRHGQLLGHLNLEACVCTHDSVVVENRPPFMAPLISPSPEYLSPTIETCHISMKKLRFGCDGREVTTTCIVAEKELPAWFWGADVVVRFDPDHWERISP